MVNPLINALVNATLDPEYFCENVLVLCHDGDYQMFHAEDYINKQLSAKKTTDSKMVNNEYLN